MIDVQSEQSQEVTISVLGGTVVMEHVFIAVLQMMSAVME